MKDRRVSVHLILDSHSVYNSDYHALKLQLALKHGSKLVLEHDRKLACLEACKSYQPAAFVKDIIQEVRQGLPVNQAEDGVLKRMHERARAISGVEYKDSSSYAKALTILKRYPEDIDNGFANFVTRLPVELQHELFLQSNAELIQHISKDTAEVATVFIANGTRRQFYNINIFESLTLDTSCFFSDIQGLVSHLRANTSHPGLIHLDALTMYDALYDLPDGEHHKHVLASISQITHHTTCQHIDFISIYLHAHLHANRHGDHSIEMHCYVHTDSAHKQLEAQLIQYGDHLPANVRIVLQKYNGAVFKQTECIGRAQKSNINYRHHANRMIGGISSETFTEITKTKDRYYAVMLDADNCIYNIYYYQLLTLLVNKFGEEIVRSQCTDRNSNDIVILGKEMLRFVIEYPKKDLFAKWVNYKYMIRLRAALLKKYKALSLDADIIQTRDMMLAENQHVYENNAHGPIFCQLIRIINAISPDIMNCILLRANETLFSDMKNDAKINGDNKIVLLIASLRQSYLQDIKNSVWNGTGLFHEDLPRLVSYLNAKSVDHSSVFEFDGATLCDYSNYTAPGFHIECSDQLPHQMKMITCDNEKRLIMYKAAHHIRRKYHVDTIDFFDDNLGVLSAIECAYGKHDTHALLPAGLRVNLVGYNGRYMKHDKSVTGRGILDHHPHRLLGFVCNNQYGVNVVYSGQLAPLSQIRDKVQTQPMCQFVELTRWSYPREFFAPGRAKTIRKISRTIDILREEIDRFCASSNHVKHGMYASQKSLPAREIAPILKAIKSGELSVEMGLDKIITLSHDHAPIYNAANKLKHLMKGANEQLLVQTQLRA